jgi:hypothetical protein
MTAILSELRNTRSRVSRQTEYLDLVILSFFIKLNILQYFHQYCLAYPYTILKEINHYFWLKLVA